MPPIGLLLKGMDFKNLFISLGHQHYNTLSEAQKAGIATINYGNFISIVIEFIIVAACVFLLIKTINTLKHDAKISLATKATKTEILLAEIRDLLKNKSI